jgi:hypothetical protein
VRIEGDPALETFTEGGRFCQYDVGVAPDQVVLASMTGGSRTPAPRCRACCPACSPNSPRRALITKAADH